MPLQQEELSAVTKGWFQGQHSQWHRKSRGSSALLVNSCLPTSKQNTSPEKHSRKMNILLSPCHFEGVPGLFWLAECPAALCPLL